MPPALLVLSPMHAHAVLAAQATTTTEFVPRIVGEPLPTWVVIAASVALLAFILGGGLLVNRRRRLGKGPS